MKPKTVVAVLALVGVLAVAVVVGLGAVGSGGDGVTLEERWVSDTGRDVRANHHAPAVATVEGTGYVYAPVSGVSDTDQCSLFGLYDANGSTAWQYPIPVSNCTIHSVADPTVADYDGDGSVEVLAATTEQRVAAYDSLTGEVEFSHDLASYGYTQPVVADVLGDDADEVVVVDVKGSVYVIRANGTTAWSHGFQSYTFGQPTVADTDGDGDREVIVALGDRREVVAFEDDGTVAWRTDDPFDGTITWMTTHQLDDDPGIEIAVATTGGQVVTLDGRTGAIQWRRDLGKQAAVHAVGDADGDGTPEVYAVAEDAKLRSLAGNDGSVEWTTTLTAADVQMTPPPSLGDVDGDGEPDLVAVTNDGTVAVVDPRSGSIRGTYSRDVAIYTHPTVADVDGDGAEEAYVMYADGRVVSLEVT